MPPESFSTIATVQAAVSDLLSGTEPAFWSIGLNLFRAFATIRLVWLGVGWMYRGRTTGDQVYELVELILLLSVGFAMITYYASPIPGIGISFSNLVPSMAQYCANLLDARALETTFYHIDVISSKFLTPPTFGILENIIYWAVQIMMACTKLASMFIVLGGLIGTALMVLLGGLFVPFFVVTGMGFIPDLQFLFYGWLRALLTCSFLQVVAFAYLMLFERFLFRMLTTLPENIIAAQFLLYGTEVIALVGVFAVGALSLPFLCGMLFSGVRPPAMTVPGI